MKNLLNNSEKPIYICKDCFNNVNVLNNPHQNLLEKLSFIDENNLDDILDAIPEHKKGIALYSYKGKQYTIKIRRGKNNSLQIKSSCYWYIRIKIG